MEILLRHAVAALLVLMAVVATWLQLLFAIEDHWNTDSAVSHQQVTVPCTSQPCQWNLPKKKEIEYRAYPVAKMSKA